MAIINALTWISIGTHKLPLQKVCFWACFWMNEEHVTTKCDHVTWIGIDKTQEIYEHVVYIKKYLDKYAKKITR
jgi:hypothetical protein